MKFYSVALSLGFSLLLGLSACSSNPASTSNNTNNSNSSTPSNNTSSVITEDKKQNDGSTTLSFLNLTFTDESGATKDLAFGDIKSVKVGSLTLTKSDTNAYSIKLGESNLIFQFKDKGLYVFKTADISKLNLNEFIKKGSIVSIETSKNFNIEVNAEIAFKQLLSLAAKSNLSGIEPVVGNLSGGKVGELISKLDPSSTNIISSNFSINTNSETITESDKDLKPISGGSKLVITKGGILKSPFTLPADITLGDELTVYKDCLISKGSKISIKNKIPSDLTLNSDNSLNNDYKVSTDIILLKGSILAIGTTLKTGNDIPKMLFVDPTSVLFDDNYSSYLKNKNLK